MSERLIKLQDELEKGRLLGPAIRPQDFLSTGSTLLNLALSNRWDGGFLKGTYVLFVGDTDSGKTFICMTCLAEASINPEFDDYRFILMNKERGMLMDVERFFGEGVASRLELFYPENLEDMYFELDDLLAEEQPFICVVDSIDALSTDYEAKKFEERKKGRRTGKAVAGDYGDGKAQLHSRNIRRVLSGLERTKSIVIFINQTRDLLDANPYGPRSTHSGGRAISFYATMKIWSSVKGTINKVYKDKKRQIGIVSRIQVVRSRITGKRCEVEVPIYHSFGIDDVGSCVDYLVAEGHWKKSGGVIVAPEFELKGQKETLVRKIEESDQEMALRRLVGKVWKDIDEACKVTRKFRYARKSDE